MNLAKFSYFFGGYFITIDAAKKIREGRFEIDFLMIAAAIGAAYIGSWAEGALLLFLFSLGHALEHYAMADHHKFSKVKFDYKLTDSDAYWQENLAHLQSL